MDKNKPNKKMTKMFYDMGKMPERYYNQLNGKNAQENYNDWHNHLYDDNDEVIITVKNGDDK